MGSGEAEVYLANAWVAAAAAVAGEIVEPAEPSEGAAVIIEGRAVVIPQDDVDTDVLYPGPYLNILDVDEMKPSTSSRASTRRSATSSATTRSSSPARTSARLLARERAAGDAGLGIRCRRRARASRASSTATASTSASPARGAGGRGRRAARVRLRIDTETGEIEVDGRRYQAAPTAALVRELQAAGRTRRMDGAAGGGAMIVRDAGDAWQVVLQTDHADLSGAFAPPGASRGRATTRS